MDNAKVAVAAVLGVFAVRLEMVVVLIALVVAAMLFDYTTGMLAGKKTVGLKSGVAAKGLYKKAGFLLLLLFGFFLDFAIPYFIQAGLNMALPFPLPFGLIIAAWIVITEAISVVENLAKMGVKIPDWMGRMLEATRKKLDKMQDGEGHDD